MGIRERIEKEVFYDTAVPYSYVKNVEQLIESEALARSKSDRLALLEDLLLHPIDRPGWTMANAEDPDLVKRIKKELEKLDAAQKEINKEITK